MSDPKAGKSAGAFRTISEVSDDLGVQQHVLRFWETKFSQVKPMKRAGGRRYYRPEDLKLLARIRDLLYAEGYTIRGVQKLLKEKGVRAFVAEAGAEGAADGAEGSAVAPPQAPSESGPGDAAQSAAPSAAAGLTEQDRTALQSALDRLIRLRETLDDAPRAERST
ncbi:MAG: MerR family transcriptional regulator [Alphaproteobacteria bacterium]|nr:MerR family transcriptional regulator [Alphaproteobacteria bacterium]